MTVAQLPWEEIEASMWAQGYAQTGPLLRASECRELIDMYADRSRFRSRIEMARYRFGLGDYQYFDEPLPEIVQNLRAAFYPRLAPLANRWAEACGMSERYPDTLDEFLEQCRQTGKAKPTPLLLHYEAGGYNCLHQDLYGELSFPFQIVFVLSEPERDYTGGAFLMMEQRPRAQSIGDAVQPRQGEAILFTTRYRPVKGTRGWYRANMKHGVSRVKSGARYTLGVIFHNAK